MTHLQTIKSVINEDPAREWDRAAGNLHDAIGKVGRSRDLRDTKESIESDGGKKMLKFLQDAIKLHKKAVAAYKARGY